MILTELTSIPAASLPLSLLKNHLQVGTGFTPDSEQDELLEAYLRAAIAAVEARTGLVLLTRSFVWSLSGWRHYDRQELPVRPVSQIAEVKLIDRHGGEDAIDTAVYRLEQDAQAPTLVASGVALPVLPSGGTVEITFDGGYGPDWADVPEDLARAVLLVAADFFDNRSAREGTGFPRSVMALIEPFRKFRLGAV